MIPVYSVTPNEGGFGRITLFGIMMMIVGVVYHMLLSMYPSLQISGLGLIE
jgi:hypothetical protein